MKLLDNVKYDNLIYQKYRSRLNDILKNEKLDSLGLKYEIKGYTEYGYPFETLTLGYGEKEIFIVGGTHGSEVIGVDFVLQLIENIPNFEEFDPNLYKIIFVPIQNPEGFDITTSTYKNIPDSDFLKKSYEYYERYRIDSLISNVMEALNNLINNLLNSENILTADKLLTSLKKFINTNEHWLKLSENKALPQIIILNKYINNIDNVKDFNDLKIKLVNLCNNIEKDLLDYDYKNNYFKNFLEEFKSGFNNTLIWQEIDKKNKIKLYQLMFKDDNFSNIDNIKLKEQVMHLYEEYNHPKGSQISYDANGNGINLNANNITNPGIELLRNNYNIYSNGPKNNIVRYFKGPIGSPTKDINNFTYELENIYLENMLKESYNSGKYLSTFLYHGTGGMIYYKPHELLMDESTYQEYVIYNKTLASIYSLSTDYKVLNSSDSSGFGDYLRRTYPGVLLVELSKMGGNPIGPYGDEENIYKTINDNFNAIRNILGYYNKQLNNKIIK